MASKLNTSIPKKRAMGPPPERLSERHDVQDITRITNERQRLDPSEMAERCGQNFILDCTNPMPIPTPLFAPGRGKPAGSRRILKRGRS